MGRERVYSSNADRQAAYRARLAERRRHDAAGRDQLGRDLAAALGRVADLEATVAGVHRQLAAETTATASPPGTAGLNRAARRAAERQQRRLKR